MTQSVRNLCFFSGLCALCVQKSTIFAPESDKIVNRKSVNRK